MFGKDDIILELYENEKGQFYEVNLHISLLLKKLWESPKLVALIIEQCGY